MKKKPAKLFETSKTPLFLRPPSRTPTTRFWLPILLIRVKWSTTLSKTRGCTTTFFTGFSVAGIIRRTGKATGKKLTKNSRNKCRRTQPQSSNENAIWRFFRRIWRDNCYSGANCGLFAFFNSRLFIIFESIRVIGSSFYKNLSDVKYIFN